jgi:hypothetical protein
LLTIWEPTEEQLNILKEGTAFEIQNLAVRETPYGGLLQMTASTRTPIESIDLDVSSQSHLGYENRRFLGVFQIHALSHKLLANDFASKTRWPDVDTVAVHVKSIEPSDSARGYRIYVTDESQLML